MESFNHNNKYQPKIYIIKENLLYKCHFQITSTKVIKLFLLSFWLNIDTHHKISFFENISQARPDAILNLSQAFKIDTNKDKVNLGVGAYRTEEGKPYVFEVVRKVEQNIVDSNLDKEYAPIEGDTLFLRGARKVIFGFDN